MNIKTLIVAAALLTGCASTGGFDDRWAMVLAQGAMGIAAANAYGSGQWADMQPLVHQNQTFGYTQQVESYQNPMMDDYHRHPGVNYGQFGQLRAW